MTAGAALAASVVLLGACGTSEPDPCAGATTCIRLEIDSFIIQTIDQIELDLVYDGHHATTTTGARGASFDLPVDTAVILDLPTSQLIEIDVIAAAKLGGVVLGGDASSKMVQQGHSASMFLDLGPYSCIEGGLYCGGVGSLYAESRTLYQCTGAVPRLYARCTMGCTDRVSGQAVCYGTGLCRDGGTYCGGNMVDGDPFTLYICDRFDGISPTRCPDGCLVRGDGDDVCT